MKFGTKEVNRQTFQDTIANRISKGAIIEGELKSETDIRIDGKIKGILHCAAKVVIGPTGEMEGEINCKDASLEGRVTGKLEVNGVLFLKKTARIEGEIYYKRLIVEEGANITGTLIMSGGTTKSLIQDSIKGKTKLIENSQQTA
ncbi:MAG: polymer-forming cytoskeletal protein [Bacteroidetes bacterium]|nr:polymer-forming cytoskeletal protein [Bacteroidota bacterium]